MVSSIQTKITSIRSSKIVHKSSVIHSQARFVTEDAVCLMFRINSEEIYTVECWRYIVYVHGKGVSKFVSYADFPPIIDVGSPTSHDCSKWRKRWRKSHDYPQKNYAPHWWAEFLTFQFSEAASDYVLKSWWQLLSLINFAFSHQTLQQLTNAYKQAKL